LGFFINLRLILLINVVIIFFQAIEKWEVRKRGKGRISSRQAAFQNAAAALLPAAPSISDLLLVLWFFLNDYFCDARRYIRIIINVSRKIKETNNLQRSEYC
jgi:hypothetical protein